MSKTNPINRIIHAIRQQSDDLCIEVRQDQNIVIIHLDNGEKEVIKFPPDKFSKIYELLAANSTPIQKPENIR